ncbi:MAG: hypothetical protein II978_07600 [Clostridia bacterium]|nr:hypothetical protein [Clostridia bacterium]
MEKKRVLVCSVSCWNKYAASDTFPLLLEGYGASYVANLYIRNEIPDSPVCKNYFCISENAVIKSILNRKIKTGRKVFAKQEEAKSSGDEFAVINRLYQNNVNKRRYLLLYAREILWKLGCWKSKELDAFLDEFKPDTVFFVMEGYIHLNRISRYILKRTGAKGVGYFWDDNFTYKQSNSLGYKIYRFFQRRDLKKSAKMCSNFFAITPKTKKEADEFFGINCEVLTKPIDYKDAQYEKPQPSLPLKMLYTGKLIIGRFDTVKLIGEALDEINKNDVKIELDVYTTTVLDEKMKSELSPYVHILGAIPQTEVEKVQKEADVLLFAEAIAGKKSKAARLSFSTKLTDYFRSGKCILAVGNEETAPMEYLKEEDAAIIASDKEGLINALLQMTENLQLVSDYGEKAYECGKKNHDKEMIQKRLFNVLNGEK